MNITEIMDIDLLTKMRSEGFISQRSHPSLPLYILNYTARAQYGREWNDATTNCRGLIVDGDGEVVARPFPKFFNLTEHLHDGALPEWASGPFTAYDKLDGSLGILWQWEGHEGIATRGSFDSSQAQWATAWWDRNNQWDDHIDRPSPLATWCFEIIYPANRIVVDYGDHEALHFLGAVDKLTGRHVPASGPTWLQWARCYGPGDDPASVLDACPQDEGAEGVVLYFHETGHRVKVKREEYVRLHRLMSSTSTKTVWEALRDGRDPEEMAQHVPDEFHAWLRDTIAELRGAFDEISVAATAEFATIEHLRDDRKAFAAAAVKSPHRALLFGMLDGKDVAALLWKQLKPEHSRPYVDDEEDA